MANIDIRVGKKDAVFFSANPTLILKDGQFLRVRPGFGLRAENSPDFF